MAGTIIKVIQRRALLPVKLCLFALLFFSNLQLVAQDIPQYGPWIPNKCWKGILYRVKRANAAQWDVQFQNTYGIKVFFSFDLLPYADGVLYEQHKKVNMNSAQAGVWKPGEISGSFFIDQRYTNDLQVYVLITDINFGDTQDGLTARCGENFNSNPKSPQSNNTAQVDYNDTATPVLGNYNLLTSINGVDIYAADLKMGKSILAVQFKLINHNPYKTGICWQGPVWFTPDGQKLSDIDPNFKRNPIYGVQQFGFSDVLQPGEEKEAPPLGNTKHAAEPMFGEGIYYANWLSLSAPVNDWNKRPLTYKLMDVRTLVERNGRFVSMEQAAKLDAANTPVKHQEQVKPAPTTTPVVKAPTPVYQYKVTQRSPTTSTDVQMQNGAQADINQSQNTDNPIMQATYLSNAKIKLAYEQAHGNNSIRVQELKQQIADLERKQAAQNQQNLQNSLNSLRGTTPTVDATQNLMNLIDQNSNLESEKSNNKQEVKKSMSDFFNNVKFKNDTVKTDKPAPVKP